MHVHHFHPDFNGKTKYVTKLVAEKVLFMNGFRIFTTIFGICVVDAIFAYKYERQMSAEEV